VYDNIAYFENSFYDDRIVTVLENAQDLISRTIYSDKTYSIETFDVTRFAKVKPVLIKNCPDIKD
jgi:hypothetical protein